MVLQVFRFKTGGLNELIHILRSWKYFKHTWHKESQQHTFTVFQPRLSLLELHPLEGTIASMLTADMWRDLKDGEGRIIDKHYVLKVSGKGGGGERETIMVVWLNNMSPRYIHGQACVMWQMLNTCSCNPLNSFD